MKSLMKTVNAIALIVLMFSLYGCKDDDTAVTFKTKDLSFSATNLSDLNKVSANSVDENSTYGWTINIEINGSKYSYSGESKKNVLPVLAGNEIEVTFNPSVDEYEAVFTLPDGTIQNVTRTEPSFKWTVPLTIKSGDQITGVSSYRKDKAEYKNTGRILFEIAE